jgi:hypothetical protein
MQIGYEENEIIQRSSFNLYRSPVCLRLLQNSIICFQWLHLSSAQSNAFVLSWSASVLSRTDDLVYIRYFQPFGGAFQIDIMAKRLIRW